MTDAVVAEGLTRRYGDVVALDGLDLAVEEGTVLGVLGPNGAGKTTSVRILSTLLRADEGRATVAGYDVATHAPEVRRRIGLSGQYAAVDEELTARENLQLIGRLYHLGRAGARERADELVSRFELDHAADRPVSGFSGGMRRRVDLACAVVARPEVLFLDEPTTGLDPRSRVGMWSLITEMVAAGTTLLLTTQYLEEADQLADRIAVIDDGRLVAEGTPGELKSRLGAERLEITLASAADLSRTRAALARLADGELTLDESDLRVVVPVTDGSGALLAAVRLLDGAGVAPTGAAVRTPSLDEVFFALTERPAVTDTDAVPPGARTDDDLVASGHDGGRR